MASKYNLEGVSVNKREKIFELEKQNIESIIKRINKNNLTRKKSIDTWTTSQYNLENCTIYELKNDKDSNNTSFIITSKLLQGLTWKDLLSIQANNIDYKTKIENGAWITYYNNKIRYSIAYNNKIIVNIQIEKNESEVVVSINAETEDLKNTIVSNLNNSLLVANALKNTDFKEIKINNFVNDLSNNCISINKYKVNNELLIIEKQELQEEIKKLTLKINDATKQIDDITDKINIAETRTNKITKENENLKSSIANVRKMLIKRCSFIPILGRLIIRDLNKEFGENALPSGK